MSKEFQNHIFEPFTQETGGARSVYGGTGLGMPITKKLVEKMGGTIKFKSEKNVGTTFMVQLPFLISADMKQAESQEDDVSIEGMRILLAEDNELNMEIAEFLLTNAGAEIIKASNGKEAVEAFAKSGVGEINVILMDIMMPVMDGLEATREIRTMNRSDASAVVIIAMTANAFTEDKTKALKSGMDDYLTKPFDMDELIACIASLIRRYTRFNQQAGAIQKLNFDGLQIDLENRSVTTSNGTFELPPKEFDLLLYCAKHQGKILTKQQIYEEVWGEEYFYDDSNIMAIISRLRKKLEVNPSSPKYIQTVKGIGYRFNKEV